MTVIAANFHELYRRHLCRHAQFGLNLLHLLAVLGIYFGLVGLVATGIDLAWPGWGLAGAGLLLVPYFGLLAAKIPARVWILTALVMGLVLAVFVVSPQLPCWLDVALILGLHQFQQLSHRWYPLHRDMSEFNGKYIKGPVLFVTLAVYELPILLNYLAFGRSDWVR